MHKNKDKFKKEGPPPPKRSKPERKEETEMPPEQMGNIFVPDRSGVSNIRDRGR